MNFLSIPFFRIIIIFTVSWSVVLIALLFGSFPFVIQSHLHSQFGMRINNMYVKCVVSASNSAITDSTTQAHTSTHQHMHTFHCSHLQNCRDAHQRRNVSVLRFLFLSFFFFFFFARLRPSCWLLKRETKCKTENP